jgi:hypothetical protein
MKMVKKRLTSRKISKACQFAILDFRERFCKGSVPP